MDTGGYTIQLMCVVLVQCVTTVQVTAQRTAVKSGACGSIPNNPSTTICCNGLIYVRSGAQPGCCGSVGYDARNYLCCSNNIVRKDQYKVPRCCGTQGYDRMKDNCVKGNMVKKKADLGSHCCMTDSGWKCCNRGENCCSYTGSGQVEITGFRPVCCERGSFREKAECCANIMETTGVLPSCCQTSDLKPKCCNHWGGSLECCTIFGTCCTNDPLTSINNNGGGRGVPIIRDPVRPAAPKPRPTEPYYYPAGYYTTKKAAPRIPQCCLVFQNRPSCCYSLHINPTCCSSGGINSRQQTPDRETVDNQVSRSQQQPNYCCTRTRRTCCPKITSSRVSKVAMQPCCYSSNKPRCCYTSQAYSSECCRSDPNRVLTGQSKYIPPGQSKDVNQALEARYSNARGQIGVSISPVNGNTIKIADDLGPSRSVGRESVPISPGDSKNIKNVDDVESNRWMDRDRVNRGENNRWTDETRTTRGYNNIIGSNTNTWTDDERNSGRRYDNRESIRPVNESQYGGGGNNNLGSNRWTDERRHGGNGIHQSNQDKRNEHRNEKPGGRENDDQNKQSVITTTTKKYTEESHQRINQNDILAYEHCCYLTDRRTCCKEAYMATGTLPYCCSSSIEKENMASKNEIIEWDARDPYTTAPGYQSKIKIAEPEPEPKFIPEYALFGDNEYVVSGIVSEISPNEIPGFKDWDMKRVPAEKEQPSKSDGNMLNIIKAIIVDSRSHTTTKGPTESKTAKYQQVTEMSLQQSEIPPVEYEDDIKEKVDNENTHNLGKIKEQRPDVTEGSENSLISSEKQDKGLGFGKELDSKSRINQIGDVTKNNQVNLGKSIEDFTFSEREDVTQSLPTIFPMVDSPKTDDNVLSFPYPALNDSIFVPSNIIGQPVDTDVIKTKDSQPDKENVTEPTVSENQITNIPGWSDKENIPFENEYQQPDTLDNPFPYIPSANDVISANHVPTEDPPGGEAVVYPVPDYDSVGPHLNPEVYNYYSQGGEYPEYMMCGDEPYMMNVYICCDGVLRYRYGVRPRCCGTEAYDDFTYKCCDGLIMRSCDPSHEPKRSAWGRFI